MRDDEKTREQLVHELLELRREVAGLAEFRRERQEAQWRLLQQLREAAGQMRSVDDVPKLLGLIRGGLETVGVSFQCCGINVLDMADPPLLTSHLSRGASDIATTRRWVSSEAHGIFSFLEQIWRSGNPAYRPDLQVEDAYQEADHITAQYGPTRSVLDVPFSHGTLIVTSAEPDAFDEPDIAFMQILVDVLSDGFRALEDLQDLSMSEARYQQLVETPNFVVMLVDPEGRFIYVSPQVEEWIGLAPREFYRDQDTGQRIVHRDDRDAVRGASEEALRGALVQNLECRWAKQGGDFLWVSASIFPIYESAEDEALNRVDVIQIVVQDIDDRRRAEEALQRVHEHLERLVEERTSELSQANRQLTEEIEERARAEENLRAQDAITQALLHAIPDLMFRISRDGTFVDFVPSSGSLPWVPPSEFLGKKAGEVLPPDVAEKSMRSVEEALQSGEMQRLEYELPVGSTARTYESRTIALNDDEVLSIVRDITESKQAEMEMVRGVRLRALGEMAAGVSHNLNNILVGILSPAQLIQMRLESPGEAVDEAQTAEFVDLIVSSSRRAADLVHRLHQAVRGEDDNVMQPVLLNAVVQQAVQAAAPRWKDEPESRGISVEVVTDLAENAPPIRGTQSGLYDVLINLVFNAVDALPDGGTITVHTRRAGERAELAVSDNGIGMEPETRQRVFEPFFTTKMDVGTGLGLATVHGTVTRWGGEIDVTSQPGRGTTFTILFPIWVQAPIEEAEGAEVQPPHRGRILIIDDDEVILLSLSSLLSRDHDVDTVKSSPEAVERFEPGRYDVALIDLGLPEIPGDELAARLQRSDPRLATILITGWELQEGDPRLAVFDFHIQKPFTRLKDVSTRVVQAIGLNRRRAAERAALQPAAKG